MSKKKITTGTYKAKQQLQAGARLWLTKENNFFGIGAARLLTLVERTGAVRMASLEMEMSYSKARKILARMERELGCVIVSRRVGGRSEGRANVTREGKELLQRYEQFVAECNDFVKKSFEKHFDGYGCGKDCGKKEGVE